MLTYRDWPRRNILIRLNTPDIQCLRCCCGRVTQRIECPVSPSTREMKFIRALAIRDDDHEEGICRSQMGNGSPASAAIDILNMNAAPTRMTGHSTLLKNSSSWNVLWNTEYPTRRYVDITSMARS